MNDLTAATIPLVGNAVGSCRTLAKEVFARGCGGKTRFVCPESHITDSELDRTAVVRLFVIHVFSYS